MRLAEIIPIYLKHIPQEIEEGKLYISEEYEVAIHSCACGCGIRTVTPLIANGEERKYNRTWYLKGTRELPSLEDSIENKHCGAHYYIKEGKIQWC